MALLFQRMRDLFLVASSEMPVFPLSVPEGVPLSLSPPGAVASEEGTVAGMVAGTVAGSVGRVVSGMLVGKRVSPDEGMVAMPESFAVQPQPASKERVRTRTAAMIAYFFISYLL